MLLLVMLNASGAVVIRCAAVPVRILTADGKKGYSNET